MAEYINREEYCEKHCRCSNEYCDKESCSIWKAPTADVTPVVHGRWVDGKCSNCGVDIPTDDEHDAIFETECRFCYYCGAKMDGGADNEAD